MPIRREMAPILIWGTALMFAVIAGLILFCLAIGNRAVHLSVVAVLTTSGPLIARIFEGMVRRKQLIMDLDRDCLAAEDEILISRTVPLLMPVTGAVFAYAVMM